MNTDFCKAEPFDANSASGELVASESNGFHETVADASRDDVDASNQAMKPSRKSDDEDRNSDELDMTPMVDVTFLLLIFFMVTASFSLQKSITMPREQSDSPSPHQQPETDDALDLVTVQINEFNAFTVLAADWEREVPGKQNLIRALRDAKPESETLLKIEVHEDAVIEAVVDTMDAGAEIGYSKIQMTEMRRS